MDASEQFKTIIPQQVIERILEKMKREQPNLQALLLTGSFARGEGSAESDVDMVGYTTDERHDVWYMWFENSQDRLMHFSIVVEKLEKPMLEPAEWSLGLPVFDPQIYIWATEKAKEILGSDPSAVLPPKEPELEDFIEFANKVRRAGRTNDSVLLRWSARMLAETSAGLLLSLNKVSPVRTAVEAIRTVLNFSNAPEQYRQNFEICYGLKPSTDEIIAAAAHQLAGGMIEYLSHQASNLSPYLTDGTIKRYLDI